MMGFLFLKLRMPPNKRYTWDFSLFFTWKMGMHVCVPFIIWMYQTNIARLRSIVRLNKWIFTTYATKLLSFFLLSYILRRASPGPWQLTKQTMPPSKEWEKKCSHIQLKSFLCGLVKRGISPKPPWPATHLLLCISNKIKWYLSLLLSLQIYCLAILFHYFNFFYLIINEVNISTFF